MAIYHLSIKTISRGKGQSAIASAAYRAGDRLYDKRYDKVKDFRNKSGIKYSEIQIPSEAPLEYLDRETLWNAVESAEKQANARLSREIEVALPKELNLEQQKKLLYSYVQENFVSEGMCADWSIHDKNDGNPHAHIMLTVRSIKKNGLWAPKRKSTYKLDSAGNRIPVIDPKTGKQKLGARNAKQWERISVSYNDWNNKDNVEIWRSNWAKSCNRYLNFEQQIDHRSYERQGKVRIPSVHEGWYARKIEKQKEGSSELVSKNKEIERQNMLIQTLQIKLEEIKKAIERVKNAMKRIRTQQEAQIHERLRKFRRSLRDSGSTSETDKKVRSRESSIAETTTTELIRKTRANRRNIEIKRQFAEDERKKREAKRSGSSTDRKQQNKRKYKSLKKREHGPSL